MSDCPHPESEVYWRAATAPNEDHWFCGDCQANLGFRPDLDRRRTFDKVHGILLDFHEAKLIYVSNGTMGLIIAENVTARCQDEDRYDQLNILRFILADPNMNPDSTFWRERATEWRAEHEAVHAG